MCPGVSRYTGCPASGWTVATSAQWEWGLRHCSHEFWCIFCLHNISVLYFLTWSEDADQTFLSNSVFFTTDQWRILIIGNCSLYRCQLILFSTKMYRLDPDKNRACTRRTVSVRRFFWTPKENVKKMDKKIFTILCWIVSLLSRPRNKGILALSIDLWFYTERRLRSGLASTLVIRVNVKNLKMLHNFGTHVHNYNILFLLLSKRYALLFCFRSDIKERSD